MICEFGRNRTFSGVKIVSPSACTAQYLIVFDANGKDGCLQKGEIVTSEKDLNGAGLKSDNKSL